MKLNKIQQIGNCPARKMFELNNSLKSIQIYVIVHTKIHVPVKIKGSIFESNS